MLTEVTVSGNYADQEGGGLSNSGSATISNSLIANNATDFLGGGIYNSSTLEINNSTLSGNTATDGGGGVANSGTAEINNSTVFGNSTLFRGGGIHSPGTTTIYSTIIAGNTADIAEPDVSDFSGSDTLLSIGFNLIGNDQTGVLEAPEPTDQIGTPAIPIDPLLDPLGDNSGPTLTHRPQSGSPAIDKGDCAVTMIAEDQRGLPRPIDDPFIPDSGDGCDIGAVEVTFSAPPNAPPVADAGFDQPAVECTGFSGAPVTLDGSFSMDPDPGDTLTFEWRDVSNTVVGTTPRVFLTLSLGTHTFILTVDDGRGGIDADSVVITIQDTNSPIVGVVTDVFEVPAPNFAGTVGELVAASGFSAIDACTSLPTITAAPTGPYPLGETVVSLTAIDTSLNSATLPFIVSVPARVRKEEVQLPLLAIGPTGSEKADRRISKAINELDKSLAAELWVDTQHVNSKKVFDHERRAAKELLKLLNGDKCGGVERLVLEYTGDGPVTVDVFNKNDLLVSFPGTTKDGESLEIDASALPKGKLESEIRIVVDGVEVEKIHTSCSQPIAEGDVHGDFVIAELNTLPGKQPTEPPVSEAIQAVVATAITDLVAVDRLLAQTRLDDVQGLIALNPDRQDKVDREIAKADAEMVKAAADEVAGKPEKAISHYKKAWEHAGHAEKEAVKL